MEKLISVAAVTAVAATTALMRAASRGSAGDLISLAFTVAGIDVIAQLAHGHGSTVLERIGGIELHKFLGRLVPTDAQARLGCGGARVGIGALAGVLAGHGGHGGIALGHKI